MKCKSVKICERDIVWGKTNHNKFLANFRFNSRKTLPNGRGSKQTTGEVLKPPAIGTFKNRLSKHLLITER